MDTGSGDGGSPGREGLPESLGPYRILALLGRGGMGEVFLASDSRLKRRVAIKRIRQDVKFTPTQRERLLREAQAIAALSHPSIVHVNEMLEDEDGNDCIVMEYVEGPTLAAALLKQGPWQPLLAVGLAREIASGLAAAHAGGILHRDLKTENVMLTLSGHAKILDFGLAKPIVPVEGDTTLTEAHCVMGTCRSMSPEQARSHELDERSDLFSLGVLLYEMLTGEAPFHGTSAMATLAEVLSHQPPRVNTLRPEVSPRLSTLVARLLEKDPACRPQSAEEVIQELETITAAAFPPLFPSDETVSELPTGYSHPPSGAGSAPVQRSTAAPASTGGMSVPRRHVSIRAAAFSVLGVIILGIVAALVWPFIRPPARPPAKTPAPSIRVVVLEPSLKVKDERLQLAAQGVSTASLSILNSLAGVTTLDYEKFIGQPTTDQAKAQAAAADEVLKATISRESQNRVTIELSRIQGSDGQILWKKTLSEPIGPGDLLRLSQDVRLQLIQGYRAHLPRPKAFLEAQKEDYETFLKVKLRVKTLIPCETDPDLSLLQGIMTSSPLLLEARLLKADILLSLYQSSKRISHLDEAMALVQGAEQLAPNDTRWLISQFKIELEREPPDVPARTLSRIEKRFPSDHPVILTLRAKLEEKEGSMDRALADLRKSADLSPTWKSFDRLADLEGKAGHIEDARTHLDKVLRENPDNIWTLNRLAELELRYGDLTKAERLYLDLTHRSPAQALLTNLGVTQVLLQHYREAIASFRQALRTDGDQAQVNLNLAEAELALEQKPAAEILFRTVLEQIEKNKPPAGLSPVDSMVKAQCLAHLHRKPEAVEITLETLQQRPEDIEILQNAAQVYALVGDPSSAITTAKKALQKGVTLNWFRLPAFDSLRNDPDFRKLITNPPRTLAAK